MSDVSCPRGRRAPPASVRWRPYIPTPRGAATPAGRRAWPVLIGQECVSGPPRVPRRESPIEKASRIRPSLPPYYCVVDVLSVFSPVGTPPHWPFRRSIFHQGRT